MPMIIADLKTRPAVEAVTNVEAKVIPSPTVQASTNGTTNLQPAIDAVLQLKIIS